jgi:hypothetical protein
VDLIASDTMDGGLVWQRYRLRTGVRGPEPAGQEHPAGGR